MLQLIACRCVCAICKHFQLGNSAIFYFAFQLWRTMTKEGSVWHTIFGNPEWDEELILKYLTHLHAAGPWNCKQHSKKVLNTITKVIPAMMLCCFSKATFLPASDKGWLKILLKWVSLLTNMIDSSASDIFSQFYKNNWWPRSLLNPAINHYVNTCLATTVLLLCIT